jgi:dihydropteroate synthase
MGVLNVTPDSFSDGGRYLAPIDARKRVDELLEEGADIIDIGGESTRPGASTVPAADQIERIRHPLIHAARERGVVVSVDTTSPAVARFALSEGATIVNDVSCLADIELGRAVAESGGALVIMHARGSMSSMRGYSDAPGDAYGDVVADVAREWRAARDRAVASGVAPGEIVFDPGLGYMKNGAHSLELLRRLGEFATLGAPMLVGPSRKSFIAKATGSSAPPSERLGGTIAACLAAADRGADILRVHDVAEVKQALALHRALEAAHA